MDGISAAATILQIAEVAAGSVHALFKVYERYHRAQAELSALANHLQCVAASLVLIEEIRLQGMRPHELSQSEAPLVHRAIKRAMSAADKNLRQVYDTCVGLGQGYQSRRARLVWALHQQGKVRDSIRVLQETQTGLGLVLQLLE